MSKARRAEPPRVVGRWRITWMEMWDDDYCDMEVPAFIKFQPGGLGAFQFGLVSGRIDYRAVAREDKPAVEWSWEGTDEWDPVSGRGWAVLESAEKLNGRIFFHLGDDSAFTAEKKVGKE